MAYGRTHSGLHRGWVALFVAAAALVAPAAAQADLTLAGQFGSGGTGNGQFQVPQGVAVDKAGNVFVADQNGDRIERFDSSGNFTLAFAGPGQLNGPQGLSLDPQGNVLISDSGNYRVMKYSPTGTLLTQYGKFGSAAGQFHGNPRGVAADSAGNVYAIDSGGGGLVDVFAPDGTFLRSWGTAGTGPGQWQIPRGIGVDAQGHVYVGDVNNHRVDVFNGDGTFVRMFGTAMGPGQLGSPNDVDVDSTGAVFVADTGPGGIAEFTADGNFVGRTSNTGDASDGFRPYDIAIGPGDDVWATDTNKSRVLHFSQAAPPPVTGVTTNATPVTGTVRVRLAGTTQFVDLSKQTTTQVAVGSEFDTTHGTVALDLAKPGGGTQTGQFSKGMFTVAQGKKDAQTTMTLSAPLSCKGKVPAGGAARLSAAAKKAKSRSLFSNVKGNFRTRGRNSAATVRGTQWVTKDTCAGTLTTVRAGTVIVRDFTKRKNVTVKKGHHYLARAPKS